MKKLHLCSIDIKVLEMALLDDDRVQNHYSQQVFNCHYLSDYISKLRIKLGTHFKDDGFNIIQTETHLVTKIDGKKVPIGIYRLAQSYKTKIKKVLKNHPNHNPTKTADR